MNVHRPAGSAFLEAVSHGFFWLVVGNGVGVLLALLLVYPEGNLLLGQWTYGRWVPVHLNLQLFGWTSLPLVAWLLRVYRVDESGLGAAGRAAVWSWSVALGLGAFFWLGGKTSGKIFLDWSGWGLGCFVVALVVLWVVLLLGWRRSGGGLIRLAGLVFLSMVPIGMVMAASRDGYPPVNPESGGPTGASLLGSTLSVVFLLLILPRSLGRGRNREGRWERVVWGIFALEMICFLILKKPMASHRDPGQWLGLGLLLIWVPVIPLFYRSYLWDRGEERWLRAVFFWMGLLFVSGWIAFLPGVLDEVKFTSSLVAHSHLAMAGFTSAFVIFLMRAQRVELGIAERWYWPWNLGVLGYVLLMVVVGYHEVRESAWVMTDSVGRTMLWALRLLCGVVMLGVSWSWLRGLSVSQAGEDPKGEVLVS